MVNTGITMSEDLRDDFDEVIWELQTREELPRGDIRSKVIRQLMQNYVDEHRHMLDDEGKQNPAVTA